MTAREALQGLVDGTLPDVRYAPVDRLRAVAMLAAIEVDEGSDESLTSFLAALNGAAEPDENESKAEENATDVCSFHEKAIYGGISREME